MSSNKLVRPENAIQIPGIKPGDRLWSGGLEVGFTEYVVVSVDNDNYALVCPFSGYVFSFESWLVPQLDFARDFHFTSLESAVRDAVQTEFLYHEPRLQYAKLAKMTLATGGDLKQFVNGKDFD